METILDSDINTNTLFSNESEYTLTLTRSSIEDPKELKRFVYKCERIIRMLPEYKVWIEYIHEVLNINKCEITGEYHSQATCDVHHHPISLFTLVKCVILEKIKHKIEFTSLSICEEIIKLHYQNRVPFCLLLRSIHEKFHNGYLAIPMSLIHGSVDYLLERFEEFFDDDEKQTITDRLKINLDNCGWGNSYYWQNKQYLITESVDISSVPGCENDDPRNDLIEEDETEDIDLNLFKK